MNDNVKVVVRCRPLNEKEKMMGHKQSVTVDEIRGTITVNKFDMTSEPPKTFTFDTVFSPDSKQLDVYNLTARPIIDSVLEGYNGKSKTIEIFIAYIFTFLSICLFCKFEMLKINVLSFFFRNHICIRPDRHGEDVHYGGCQSSA